MRGTTKDWSESEDKRLLELVDKGYVYAEIGRKLKRTTGAVAGRVHRLRKHGRKKKTVTLLTGKAPKAKSNGSAATIELDPVLAAEAAHALMQIGKMEQAVEVLAAFTK